MHAVRADAAHHGASGAVRADHRPDAARPDARTAARAASRCSGVRRRTSRPPGASRSPSWSTRQPRSEAAGDGLPGCSRARRMGLLEPPTVVADERRRPGDPPPAPVGLARPDDLSDESTPTASTALDARALEAEAARRASRSRSDSRSRPSDGYLGATVLVVREGVMELRRRRALPGADEHLRRSGQHPVPAAALRVARDRLLLQRRRGPASRSTPARTT